MHPFADLSAYLDGALDQGRGEEVVAHLAGCALCRMRLGELRGTARLIAALPSAVPSRSLVPRVSVPVWLAPLRTLVSLGSGVAALLFVASALIASAPTTTASATAAGGAGGAAFGQSGPAEDRKAVAPAAAPSPTTNPAAPAFAVTSTSPSGARNDSTAQSSSSAVPLAPLAQASPQTEPVGSEVARRSLGPAPLVWLALAVALAALALILQRRLRAA